MPLPLIIIVLAAAAALTITVVAIIYYDEIVKWFRERNAIKEADKDNIALTIKQKLASGDYKVVQGIFNKRTEKLTDGRVMQTKQLDSQFEQIHGDKEMVLYE